MSYYTHDDEVIELINDICYFSSQNDNIHHYKNNDMGYYVWHNIEKDRKWHFAIHKWIDDKNIKFDILSKFLRGQISSFNAKEQLNRLNKIKAFW